LDKTGESLDQAEFTKYVVDAEKKFDLNLVVKANVLKRRQNELKIEMKVLQNQIEHVTCYVSLIFFAFMLL